MVAKALAGTGEKEFIVVIIIIATTAAVAALRSGTSSLGWIYVGARRGNIG